MLAVMIDDDDDDDEDDTESRSVLKPVHTVADK